MITNSIESTPILLAIIASLGGCAIKYIEVFKTTGKVNFLYFLLDLMVAAFLGFFTFNFSIEYLNLKESYALIVNCIIGSLGSKTLDILSDIILKKYNVGYKDYKSK